MSGPFDLLGSVEHEQVVFCHDPETGLRSIIAIHSTALGPGLGGVRMAPYPSVDAALRDCLRLARGMTYKAAVAGLNLGGAKSVIIGDPATDKTEELLLAHGRFVESLAGRYVPGIDMGTTQDDLRVMGRATREVAGVGDDPSPKTALGVFTALQATAERLFGTPDLGGRAVAIQGAGHVGEALAELAGHAGAGVVLADVNAARADALASRLGARVVAARDILFTPCDILVPNAVGGVINDQTVDALRCRAVVAAANNVLDRPDHGERTALAGRPRRAKVCPVTEPYFDGSGPAAPGRPRFISPARDITPRLIYPGLRFRPIAVMDVMASFVWFEPGAHEALAGPVGCHAVDILSPLRQAMLPFMTPELFIDPEQGDG